MIRLVVKGPPTTRHEPHHAGQGRSFPDRRTVVNVNRWRLTWEQAGAPRIDGPVTIRILIECRRPPSHFTTKGELSSSGRRLLVPPRPDCSNVLKLIEDALKGHAFGDDSLVAHVDIAKTYDTGEAQTTVTIRSHLSGEWRGFEWERRQPLTNEEAACLPPALTSS